MEKEIKSLETQVAIMTKDSILFLNLRKETKLKSKKFKIVYQLRQEKYSLNMILNFLHLSKSGYYKHTKEKEKREEKDLSLFLQINEVFQNSKQKKGYRQIAMNLTKNHKQVQRIMNKYGLRAKIRKINRTRVTLQKNKENIFVGNILNRKFRQKIPYTFASTDITYLKHQNKFSFLSVTKDLASGELLAWKLSKNMNLKLVLDTVDNLKKYFRKNHLDLNNLLLHSDQGFQYTNLQYHNKLKDLKITQSMSRKGNSVDNAPIESFFGHMKDEIDCSELSFNKLQELIDDNMIEYNNKRKQ